MSKGRKTGIIICSVLIAATLAFIWGNSAVSKAESAEESGKVYGVFAEFFNAIFGEGVITHKIFRKIAHFSEYALLGVEIYALISLTLGIRPLVVLSSFQFGLYAAVIDESIQILSERGALVSDVLLDFCGYAFGAALFLVVFLIVKAIKRNRLHNNKV